MEPAKANTWSKAVSPSRMLPSAARAISATAASSACSPSADAIFRSWPAMALSEIVRNSCTCEREMIVSGIFCSSVVAIMKTTCGGGSSIDFNSALKECEDSWCTSSMMNTRKRSRTGGIDSPEMITSRTLSTWVWVAASISRTSMSRPSAISTHASHVPQGSGVGPGDDRQLSARARMRAEVVFPTPRGPANTNACATRPPVIAFCSVRVTPPCPTTSSKRWGRHLRARTW